MKTNKKAILGMLVAIVMSLGVMNGIQYKQSEDTNLQHICIFADAVGNYAISEGETALGYAYKGIAWGGGIAAGYLVGAAGAAIFCPPALIGIALIGA
jgi:hypothetical protein